MINPFPYSDTNKRFHTLDFEYKRRFGKKTVKIPLNAGLGCPNRDGTCGHGGCIYCGERGAGEHIDPTLSIGEQVRTALSVAKDDDIFVAYFQNFTNTYADVETLKE